MASPGAGPSAPPAPPAPPVDPAVAENDAIDEGFFQCGAVDLAIKLIGQFLHFHDDNIKVRILETEAYPAGDGVYNVKFVNAVKPQFEDLKGGTLLAWSPPVGAFRPKQVFKHVYISAGPQGTGDVVLIRSCEPISGEEELLKRRSAINAVRSTRKNLLINPLLVSAGLGGDTWEFTKDAVLYRGEGAQLLRGTLAENEKLKYGKRILKKDSDSDGTDSMYRFALMTERDYAYEEKRSLVDFVV